MLQILLIEDDQRVSELIKRSLEEHGFTVSIAYDGNMGKKLALNNDIDLLLEYVMQNRNSVLSRTEIADYIWETHFDTGINFIDVNINYLRKKVDKDFSKKLIHTKPGIGFIFKEEVIRSFNLIHNY
jgi:DNA-binding response OmpR family regulator